MSQPPPVGIRPTLSGLTGVDDLAAIEALTGTGFLVRTASNTWAVRSLAEGTGIDITDADAVAGNPTIAWSGSDISTPNILVNGEFFAAQRGNRSSDTVVGNTTSGSAVVSSIASGIANIAVGMGISGTGITAGTTVASIDSATQITLSANATATNSSVSLATCTYNNAFCGADRWLFLGQSGRVLSGVGSTAGGYISVSGTGTGRSGIAQWVESAVADKFGSRTMTFQCSAASGSGTPTIRCALLAWTGTADTLSTARDPVNDWTSGTFTAGNFFKSTTMTVVATGSITGSTTPQTLSCSGTLPASPKNLCAMVWIDSTSISPIIGFCDLFPGSATRTFIVPNPADTVSRCERFYFKTFAMTQPPRPNIGAAGSNRFYTSYATGGYVTHFRERLHRVPAITVYNTGDTQTGSFRNATAGSNLTAVAGTATDHGVVIGSAAATADNEYQFHLTADAEIQ